MIRKKLSGDISPTKLFPENSEDEENVTGFAGSI